MRSLLLIVALLLPSSVLRAGDYEDAVEAYRDSRLKDAVRLLKPLVKKDPDNGKAWALLGAAYYQNQELKKARKAFEEADVDDLSRDTSFAWGSTYLDFDEYKKAAKGFRHALKHKGPFRSYSRYYLGVCYYELGQYSRARRQFEQAKAEALPAHIRLRRESYLADIKKRQDVLLSAFVGQGTINGNESAPLGEDTSSDGEGVAASAGVKDEVFSLRFRPSASLIQVATSADNNNAGKDSGEVIAQRIGAGLQMGQSGGRASVGSMDFTVGTVGYSADLNQTQLVTLAGTTGNFTSQVSTSRKENSAYVSVKPKIGFRLGTALSTEVAASYVSYLPNSKTKNAWGQSQVDIGLHSDSALSLGLDFSLQQPFDETQHKKSDDMLARLELAKNSGDFNFRLAGQLWQASNPDFVNVDRFRFVFADPSIRYRVGFERETQTEAGISYSIDENTLSLRFVNSEREAPAGRGISRLDSLDPIELTAESLQKLQLGLSIPFWDSFTLQASASFNTLGTYRYSERDAATGDLIKDYEADVQQTVYALSAVISFADWIRILTSYANTFNTYSGEKVSDPEFLRRNPDVVEDSSIIFELSKSF